MSRQRIPSKYYSVFVRLVVCLAFVFGILFPLTALASPSLTEAGDVETSQTREIVAWRTANARHYALGNGQFEAEVYPGPIHYQDAAGRWQPIDLTLRSAEGATGYAYANTRNGLRVFFKDQAGASQAVRVEAGDAWLAWEPEALGRRAARAAAPAVVGGNELLYAGVFAGVAEEYRILPNKLKHDIVLTSRPGDLTGEVFAYTVRLTLSPGLALYANGQPQEGNFTASTIELRDATGKAVLVLPAPYAYERHPDDLLAEMQSQVAAHYRVTQSAAGIRLSLEAPAAWLAAPERQYPVVLDPTVIVPNDADTYISSTNSTTNYAGQGDLWTGYDDLLGSGIDRSLLRFDLDNAGIPDNAELISATLRLRLLVSIASGDEQVDAHRVTNSWVPAETTWLSRTATIAWTSPGGEYDPSVEDSVVVGTTSGAYYSWDVSTLISDWWYGVSTNYGILLKAADESGIRATMKDFYSMDSNGGPTYYPRLQIRYVAVILTPTQQTGNGLPGTTVAYQETLTNKTDSTDSFDLTAQSSPAWTTDLSVTNTGSLAPDASAAFAVSVTIPTDALAGDAAVTTVEATSVSGTPTVSATAVLTTTVGDADLAIAKEGPSDICAGGEIVYTIAYTNTGGGAENVTLTDTLPTEVTFVDAAPYPDDASGPLVWNLGTILYGESGAIVVTGTVDSGLPVQADLDNMVAISTSSPESNTGNNQDTLTTTAHPNPVASFTSSSPDNLGETTFFTDASTIGSGSITDWDWAFGDGGSSSLQNPTHVYTASGAYVAALTVTSDWGCTAATTGAVQINQVWADFDAEPNPVALGDTVYFTDTSQSLFGAVNAWSWDFGDGSGASTAQNPSYTYSATGDYAVTLVATDSLGASDSVVYTVTVSAIAANFDSDSPVALGQTMNFTDTSASSGPTIDQWYWEFGDGSDFTGQTPPPHDYTTAGAFSVTLTITDSTNTYTSQKTRQVVVDDTQADFDHSGPAEVGQTVIFTDTSTSVPGDIAAWHWDFGDSGASVAQDPTHVYGADDTYTVTLVVTSEYGFSATAQYTVTIYPTPTADFDSNSPVYFGAPALFTDTSTAGYGSIVAWHWDFGDGETSTAQDPTHDYGQRGTYNVTLVVTDSLAGTATVVKPVVVAGPEARFASDSPVGDGTAVQFMNLSGWDAIEFFWDFGDTHTSTETNPVHLYPGAGEYEVTLVATDTYGLSDDVTGTVVIAPPPTAAFAYEPRCASTVRFTDTSTAGHSQVLILAWQWDFGDGTTSSAQNPEHIYPGPGTYSVTLTITDSVNLSATTADWTLAMAAPDAGFTATTPVSVNVAAIFTDTSSGPPTEWYWFFDDGFASRGPNTTHVYTATGTYMVTVVVANACGVDLTSQAITVVAGPQPAYQVYLPIVLKNAGH